jgi:hypothetical protein
MNIAGKLKRDIKLFEYKFGINCDPHSFLDTAVEFDLSINQTILNYKRVKAAIVKSIVDNGFELTASYYGYDEDLFKRIIG